jgi:hypothetical protein
LTIDMQASEPRWRALIVSTIVLTILAACSQGAVPTANPPATATTATTGSTSTTMDSATPQGTVEGHFNPTEAVGGGANASNAVAADEISKVMAAIPQAAQLRVSANSSPPGATGPDVTTVSLIAQDNGGLLKGLDGAGKRTLGDAILTAAATAWPNASVSLLVSDPASNSGTIIGSRPKGGPNTVIAT